MIATKLLCVLSPSEASPMGGNIPADLLTSSTLLDVDVKYNELCVNRKSHFSPLIIAFCLLIYSLPHADWPVGQVGCFPGKNIGLCQSQIPDNRTDMNHKLEKAEYVSSIHLARPLRV